MSEIPIETIKRLRLKPGDVVILKTPYTMDEQGFMNLGDMMRSVIEKTEIPNVQVVILDSEMDIEVMGQ